MRMNKGKRFNKSEGGGDHGSGNYIGSNDSTIRYRGNHPVGSSYRGNARCPFYPVQPEDLDRD